MRAPRNLAMMGTVALCGLGCRGEPAVLQVSWQEATLDPMRLGSDAWSTQGTFALVVDAEEGEDFNEAILASVTLDVCGPFEASVQATSFDAGLSVTPSQTMPLVIEPGASTSASFTFEARGVTSMPLDPNWTTWCAVPIPSCEEVRATLSVRVVDLLLDAIGDNDIHANGQALLQRELPLAFLDEGGAPLEPAPQVLGAHWSRLEAIQAGDTSIAVDELGRTVLVGSRAGETIVTALDESGVERWTRPLGIDDVSMVVLTGSDRIVLVHAFAGAPTLLGQTITASDGTDVVVAVLSSEDGSVERVTTFPGLGDQRIIDAALAPDGGLAVVVEDVGLTNWGGGGVGSGQVLVRWSADGTHSFSVVPSPGLSPPFDIQRIAIDGGGNVVLAGRLLSPVDFGSGLVEPVAASTPLGFVSYDPTGTIRHAGTTPREGPLVGLVTDARGNVQLATRTFVATLSESGTLDTRLSFVDPFRDDPVSFALRGDGEPVFASGSSIFTEGDTELLPTQVACEGHFQLASGSAGDMVLLGRFSGYVSLDQGPLGPADEEGATVVAGFPATP